MNLSQLHDNIDYCAEMVSIYRSLLIDCKKRLERSSQHRLIIRWEEDLKVWERSYKNYSERLKEERLKEMRGTAP